MKRESAARLRKRKPQNNLKGNWGRVILLWFIVLVLRNGLFNICFFFTENVIAQELSVQQEKEKWEIYGSVGTLSKAEIEVNHFVSINQSIGVLATYIDHRLAYGIKINSFIAEVPKGPQLRIFASIFYCPSIQNSPETTGSLFLWPVLESRWKLRGVDVSVGIGLVCAGWFEAINVESTSIFGSQLKQEREIPMAFVRHSFHSGITIPLVESMSLKIEGGFIPSGLKLGSNNWLEGSSTFAKLTLGGSIL